MLAKELIDPKSIVVVGGSNDVQKPGGKILKNILEGGYNGQIYVSNPKEDLVQGVRSYRNLSELPQTDLAIIAIASKFAFQTIEFLTEKNETKGFIIISAGFGEENKEGAELEARIVAQINKFGGSLIGPNCTGILTKHHHSIFTEPIPKLASEGVDFISGSGATACFIMEKGVEMGLMFSSVFSVGNSAQIGVEEVLQHFDESYDMNTSSKVKLLYLENIMRPQKLLKHARSLISKGCKIAAIKAGSSEAGSRAASSHTGALASPDTAVDALFRKAGIVRCFSREELITVGSIFMHPQLKGKNIAIITHAGGPAVMLTDALSKGGLEVPAIEGQYAEELKERLFQGSSVANPIDFLATGNAEQLGHIIDFVDNKFDHIDGMVVIFGTPGLYPIFDVYDLLDEKMKNAAKPIFPVLPSTYTAKKEVQSFIAKGRINFADEVTLGKALSKVYFGTTAVLSQLQDEIEIDQAYVRAIIDSNKNGFLLPRAVRSLLDGAGIPRAKEATVYTEDVAVEKGNDIGFPLVMKVVGPLHKSDVGGVVLNVKNKKELRNEFNRMISIPDTTGILLQPMMSGLELFAGAKYEDKFGHMILCGMGGIYIEVLKDISYGMAPICSSEAKKMIKSLKSYKIIEGVRGQKGVNIELLADILVRLSVLLEIAPEIKEMDLNPLLAEGDKIVAVDARIRIEK
jgi:acyl-CoA synthetase (NDP forming)